MQARRFSLVPTTRPLQAVTFEAALVLQNGEQNDPDSECEKANPTVVNGQLKLSPIYELKLI